MSRGAIAVTVVAVLVGCAAAAGVILIGTSSDDSQHASTPASTSPLQRERSTREAENHSAGDLPKVEQAARRFLVGYLPLAYGKPGADAGDLRAATPELIAELRADPGRVTPAQQQQTPRIVSVAVSYPGSSRASAAAAAQISTGPDDTYALTLRLEQTARGWQVIRLRD